jgi:hypothetical protein
VGRGRNSFDFGEFSNQLRHRKRGTIGGCRKAREN